MIIDQVFPRGGERIIVCARVSSRPFRVAGQTGSPGTGPHPSLGVGMQLAQTVVLPLLRGYQENGITKDAKRDEYHFGD